MSCNSKELTQTYNHTLNGPLRNDLICTNCEINACVTIAFVAKEITLRALITKTNRGNQNLHHYSCVLRTLKTAC